MKIIRLTIDYDHLTIANLVANDAPEAEALIEKIQPVIDQHDLRVVVMDVDSVADVIEWGKRAEED